MNAILVIVVAAAGIVFAPRVAERLFERRASPRAVAAFHLLVLIAAAVLPIAALACMALLHANHLRVAEGGGLHAARLSALALGTLYLGRIIWVAHATVRTTRRLTVDVNLVATQKDSAGVFVVPHGAPIAYTAGSWSGQVVVSQGLLDLLDEDERDAAIAHELAHLRLRHHRTLFFAQVLCAAFGSAVPPLRRAFVALRRELEVIADEDAAEQVGDRAVVARALAKVALAGPPPVAAPALGNPEDLAFRIDRLTAEPAEDRQVVAAAAVIAIGAGVVVVQCVAFHPRALVAGLALCGGSLAWLGRRALARR